MKAVEKNSFYKATTLNVASIVAPNFSDIPMGGGSDHITLKGGYQGNLYAISGNIAETPAYGESELIGGHLSVYVTGVTLANTPTLPQLELYRLKPGVEIQEGTLVPAYLSGSVDNAGIDETTSSFYPNGASMSLYHSVVDSENYYMYEGFDGADATLGDVKMVKSAGTGVVELGDAYLSIGVAKAKGKAVGSRLGQHKTKCLKKYFSNDNETVPIKPEGPSTGVWRPQIDKRNTNKKKLIWNKPYWKYKNIKGKIQFKSKAGVGSDMDASNTSTPGNTIFDEVYATANTNNPFTSDVNNPLMMTSCELSTAKKYSGAQAFRMYHLWDYSSESAYLQRALGSKQITPSMTRASIYNIPFPHLGMDTTFMNSFIGAPSTALPEISMRMNISQLGFTPFLTCKGGSPGFTNFDTYYPSGVAEASGGVAADVETITSFLRSVVVTWSNYKPKSDHVTLDKFLDYGLERFYTGEVTENIVGGVAFFKTGIDGVAGSDPSVVFASTLPVTAWKGSGGTAAGGELMVSGGLATGDIGLSDLANTRILGADNWREGATGAPRMVPLPLDSWFNMRVFYDLQAPNLQYTANTNVYWGSAGDIDHDTELNSLGSTMRVFFESDLIESGTVEDTTPTAGVTEGPYLDVLFPVGDGSSGSVARSSKYSFFNNPEFYPRHMTIWVQNYRWISGSTTNTFPDSAGIFKWGDNGAPGGTGGPLPSGAAIEAELYVDDIAFKNWTPDITNCTAGASIGTQQPLSFRQESYTSPSTYWDRVDAGFTEGYGAFRSWSTEANAGSDGGSVADGDAGGQLYDRDSTECILMGFEDIGQLPVDVTDSTAHGFILCNGFDTALYKNMERQLPKAVKSATLSNNMSTYPEYLGGQFYGAHAASGTYASRKSEAEAGTNIIFLALNSLRGTEVYTTGDTDDVVTDMEDTYGTVGSKGQINYMTYNNDGSGASGIGPVSSQDGFTSKGLFRVSVTGTDRAETGWNPWQKREHIMASTKIIAVPGYPPKGVDSLGSNQIAVQDPTIFNKYIDDEFVIYMMGKIMPDPSTAAEATGNAYTLGWGYNEVDSRNILTLAADDASIDTNNNIITLSMDVTLPDSGSSALCCEANLPFLWISPKKYWITLYQDANKTARSYQNFCVVQDVGATGLLNTDPISSGAMNGSTWNESVYGFDASLTGTTGPPPTDKTGLSGLYTNSWNLSPSLNDSTLVTNIDFGYGTFDEEKDAGGEVAQATALIQKWVDLDLSGLAADSSTSPGEDIVFSLGLNDGGEEEVALMSDEFSDVGKRPTVYWEYKDNLPKFISPLTVQPNFNILSGSGEGNKVDLYNLDRENLNSLKFSWEEEGDDILYRLLYIDSGTVQNKYDGIVFHAPLNELPAANRSATGSYYTGAARIAAGSLAPTTVRSITGSSGWAYDGNYASSTTVVDWPQTAASVAWGWFGNTEATFIGHCVPNHTGTQTQGTIMTDMDATYGSFNMYYTKAASANADVTPVFELVSGATGYSGKIYTLTSDYSFPNDGESPLFVVVTFNASLPNNNLKMYVNGMLVKQSAGNWVTDRAIYDGTGYTGKMNLGNTDAVAGTLKLRGTLQECMIHSKELHVPIQPNEYIFNNEYLPDMASGTEIRYNARLFLFDYHNIIGSSDDTVCTSNEVSWEATGV